jgi:hypothetical protein
MKRPKHKHFYCDLFGRNIYIFHHWSEKDFNRYIEKTYLLIADVSDADGVTKLIKFKDDVHVIVWTRDNEKSVASLVHECIHATNKILNDAGVDADFENDELQCYYAQRLFKIATK